MGCQVSPIPEKAEMRHTEAGDKSFAISWIAGGNRNVWRESNARNTCSARGVHRMIIRVGGLQKPLAAVEFEPASLIPSSIFFRFTSDPIEDCFRCSLQTDLESDKFGTSLISARVESEEGTAHSIFDLDILVATCEVKLARPR
jgi:hypothetical protein